jgi:uncharacterized protein (DUF2062 family)
MRDALQSLLHLDDPPRRTAIAFATGVFIAFSPFLGLHTLIAIAIAFAFGLNRVAVLAGAWINFWALVPCYVFGTFVGTRLLSVRNRRLDAGFWDRADSFVSSAMSSLFVGDWHEALRSLRMLLKSFGPLLWPFVTGNLVLAALAGLVTYWVGRRFLEARAHRRGDDVPPPPAAPEPGAAAASS